jgi:hypothetical protein
VLLIHLCSFAKPDLQVRMGFPRGIGETPKTACQETLTNSSMLKRESNCIGERNLVRLDRIFQELQNIRHRLDDIESTFSNWQPQPLNIPESELFSLPDSLRKTYLVVASKAECSATEVSNLTGRSRAIESSYLNQLARIGWLTKRRNSKTLYFQVQATQIKKYEYVPVSASPENSPQYQYRSIILSAKPNIHDT